MCTLCQSLIYNSVYLYQVETMSSVYSFFVVCTKWLVTVHLCVHPSLRSRVEAVVDQKYPTNISYHLNKMLRLTRHCLRINDPANSTGADTNDLSTSTDDRIACPTLKREACSASRRDMLRQKNGTQKHARRKDRRPSPSPRRQIRL